jgi:catechol 2,3-dioxygenase-like lactoylglutathione lyase family enzyme
MTIDSFRSVGQVALVVRDLDAAMERYSVQLGVGPWEIYTFSPEWVRRMTFRGREQGYSMRLGLTEIAGMSYELVEPLTGPSTYHEFLDAHGEGLHHLGYMVDDLEAAIADMAAAGFPVLQSGRDYGVDGDGGYAYFETGAALGCIVEAIERPRALPPPERTYPA